VNPRTGRFLNVIVAVLVIMLYSNLVSIMQAWVAQKKVGPVVGMWGVHALMLLLLAVLLARRYGVFRRLLHRVGRSDKTEPVTADR
jgi:lipopolysaccharide export system permease protein